MRCALVQFAPSYRNVNKSMARVDEMLDQMDRDSKIDLMILPEMAFTGYQFRDAEDIMPLAEVAGKGPTFEWAKKVAKQFNCGVCVGYPRLDADGSGKMYNSMLVVDPQGTILTSYDKTFLYITDKTWAEAGSGFENVRLDWVGDVIAGLGICMDINPYEFEAPWTDFELARYQKNVGTDIIIFSSAWCNRHPDDPEESTNSIDPMKTIQYWYQRLSPLVGSQVYFLAADRVGSEPLSNFKPKAIGDVTFCGSSCAISFSEPVLLNHLNETEENILVVDIPLKK